MVSLSAGGLQTFRRGRGWGICGSEKVSETMTRQNENLNLKNEANVLYYSSVFSLKRSCT